MPKKKARELKSVRPVFHVFCEGEKTEPLYVGRYLDENCQAYRRLCEMHICRDEYYKLEETRKNTPVQLVEVAVELKSKCPSNDVFWVVYDREARNKYPDELHQKAYDKAMGNGVSVAISCVCFEQWLLLHKEYSTKSYDSYDDLYKNSNLKEHFPGYEKGKSETFSVSGEEISRARKNAVKINAYSESASATENPKPYTLNPYTDMHLLLKGIDDFLAAEIAYQEKKANG